MWGKICRLAPASSPRPLPRVPRRREESIQWGLFQGPHHVDCEHMLMNVHKPACIPLSPQVWDNQHFISCPSSEANRYSEDGSVLLGLKIRSYQSKSVQCLLFQSPDVTWTRRSTAGYAEPGPETAGHLVRTLCTFPELLPATCFASSVPGLGLKESVSYPSACSLCLSCWQMKHSLAFCASDDARVIYDNYPIRVLLQRPIPLILWTQRVTSNKHSWTSTCGFQSPSSPGSGSSDGH